MDQDYFRRPSPKGETRSEFVDRIKREKNFGEFGAVESPEDAEKRAMESARYLKRHDEVFFAGEGISQSLIKNLKGNGFSVGDPEGDRGVA